MHEVISLAMMFVFLAFGGLEPSHAEAPMTCKAGAMAEFFSTVC